MTARRWLVLLCLLGVPARGVSAAVVIDMPPAPPTPVTATTQIYGGDTVPQTLGEVALARYAGARTAPLYTYLSRPWPWWGCLRPTARPPPRCRRDRRRQLLRPIPTHHLR